MGATCGSKAGVAGGGISEGPRSWQKMGFACREELAIKRVKPNTDIPFQCIHTINSSVLEMVWVSHIPITQLCLFGQWLHWRRVAM
jgi:hypothetical protein